MKTVYLLRHAKSSWKDGDLDDIDRPLNKRGKQAARAMAAHMSRERLRPDLILCSAAKRTRATLKPVRAELGRDIPVIVDKALYHAEAPDLLTRLHGLDPAVGAVLIVGHNPAMETLALRLAGSGDADARERMTVKFPTAALAVLRADIDDWRDLKPRGADLLAFVTGRDLTD